MKNLSEPAIAKWRDGEGDRLYGTQDHERGEGGAFLVPHADNEGRRVWLRVIASAGEGWDHVSVSLSNRCPTWAEMDYIKRLFFKAEETAMQLHVPARDHINNHPFCLHLWRPLKGEIPRPPVDLVGLRDMAVPTATAVVAPEPPKRRRGKYDYA